MTEEENFYHQVRLLQRRTKCSNYVCQQFAKVLKSQKGRGIKAFDKKAKAAAGVDYIELHGCPKCNKHVYRPCDKLKYCPHINDDSTTCGHPRFNGANQPFEKAFYYPMYKRLRALLRLKQFRDMLDHEYTRPRARNPNLVSDVYDSPA